MRAILLLVSVLLAPSLAVADNIGSVHAHQNLAHLGSGGAKKKNKDVIFGHCTIVPDPLNNPIGGPCVNLVLKLKTDADGEPRLTRTDTSGNFSFSIAPEDSGHIESGSRAYEVASPKRAVRGGEHVELKLKST